METKQPTEEQLREFWEGCGLTRLPVGNKHYHFEHTAKVMDWQYHDRTVHPFLPNPDLNSLFKYAVPEATKKLREMNRDGDFWTENRAIHYIFQAWEIEYRRRKVFGDAIFWAVRRVIKDE